jgi:predicted transport protein
MFRQQTVKKELSYLDTDVSSEVSKKVISYKVKAYKEYDGSVSYFVERGLIA